MWYFHVNNQNVGPIDERDIAIGLAQGVYHSGTMIWRQGMPAWAAIVNTELQKYLPLGRNVPLDAHASANHNTGMPFDFKNASQADRKKECDRIAKEFGDDQFFTKKELNHLPEVLSDGEQVLAFTSGMMGSNTWLITLTDKRIIFLDKGMIYGLKQTIIDLDKVNSISGETAIFFGKIIIEDGASSRKIENVWKKTVVPFTNKVRDAIEARKNSARPVAGHHREDDTVTKLEKLAVLLDKGILTHQEFLAQKTKILK